MGGKGERKMRQTYLKLQCFFFWHLPLFINFMQQHRGPAGSTYNCKMTDHVTFRDRWHLLGRGAGVGMGGEQFIGKVMGPTGPAPLAGAGGAGQPRVPALPRAVPTGLPSLFPAHSPPPSHHNLPTPAQGLGFGRLPALDFPAHFPPPSHNNPPPDCG